ncbi:toxin-antitoxin system HicB family antitoxin [Nonomuraea sp. NPDC050790]|uniref:toxin-antitoxin system HicB family antitoxin n=1 Tax=Nonomuraea sp. NPDC050790 TaxID=3364371 RepID=UPI00379C093A
MDLTSYADRLRRDLAVAAQSGGQEAAALAERLAAPLESSIRLILLEALSEAADEITRDLAPGSVEVRLRRGEPAFVLTRSPADLSFHAPFEENGLDEGGPAEADPPVAAGRDGGTARINFRLPEQLKAQIEEAARQEGLSVNTWLVRAVAGTFESAARRTPRRPAAQGRGRYSGWVG